jgi:hypothetical protein
MMWKVVPFPTVDVAKSALVGLDDLLADKQPNPEPCT